MNKIHKILLVLFAATSIAFASPIQDTKTVKTDVPQGHEIRKDVKLVLGIPYPVVVESERSHIYIGIQNLSSRPVSIGDLKLFPHYQLMWQARSESEGPNINKARFVPEWGRKPMLGDDVYYDKGMLKKLKAGESAIIWPCYSFDFPKNTKEVRAALLVGPKQWAVSKWVPLRYAKTSAKPKKVYTAKDKIGTAYDIMQVQIEDEQFLMCSSRIARLPKDAKPRFDWNVKTHELTVHFDGVEVPPLVHYVPMIRARKWTAEVAPHAKVLKDMKELFEKNKKALSGPGQKPEKDESKSQK